jgi:hypothetical protein
VEASDTSLDMRAAGCFVMSGADPMSANLGCSEELRASYDEILPQFEALEAGDTPRGSGKKPVSEGTALRVVRFAAGTQVSCEQVRNAMF